MDLVEEVIRREWDQFQRTENEGGRASCQGNWPMFHQMRASQFMTWPEDLLRSYLDDLDEANRVGRNLVTEKYARMMASTAPDEYRERIEPFIPRLSDERVARQERVIAVQVAWARDFRGRYPKLGAAMRVLTTAEDTPRIRRSKPICAANWAPTPTARWPCTRRWWSLCRPTTAT